MPIMPAFSWMKLDKDGYSYAIIQKIVSTEVSHGFCGVLQCLNSAHCH
jgi:hypothetical protein